MISFFLTLVRLFRGLRQGLKDPEFRSLAIFALILLITGTVFYNQTEHWSILDSLYFSITTLTTVGFGDLTPHTTFAKVFTIFYIIIGVGTLLSFVTVLAQHVHNEDPLAKRLLGKSDSDKKEKDE